MVTKTQESVSSGGDGPIVAVDLFCGGGGLSTALAEACEELDRDVEICRKHWAMIHGFRAVVYSILVVALVAFYWMVITA